MIDVVGGIGVKVKEEVKILKERNMGNYIIRKEEVVSEDMGNAPYVRERAYNKQGSWIGDKKRAKLLVKKLGIKPIKRHPTHDICSIGHSEKDNKWYGWSHRCIVGFAIGDRIYEENYGDDNTLFVKHGRKTIKNMEDARLAASNFAADVA